MARKEHLKAIAAKKNIKKHDKLDNAIQMSLIQDEPGLRNAPLDLIQESSIDDKFENNLSSAFIDSNRLCFLL